ncbi:MAG: hypothetical protein DSY33_02850 [Archaeoglobus sp.]|nr:MAG: hypothetical protein DSY33_02850 [Archaeoglobus sp.]
MSNKVGVCLRVCSGRREAVMWINPETMDCRVLHCNWFKECIRRGVLMSGHCPGYCDLISGAKHYIRGHRRRNIDAAIMSPKECDLVMYNPEELAEGEFEDFAKLSEFSTKNFKEL